MCHVPFQSLLHLLFLISRRDKYEKDVKEYWVDTETTGSFEKENEESFIDSTGIEGEAGGLEIGTHDPVALAAGVEPENVESDRDTDMDLEDDGAHSHRSKLSAPGPSGDCERLSALEERYLCFHFSRTQDPPQPPKDVLFPGLQAVDNVGSVLANLLKVQSKCEVIRDKLQRMEGTEAKQFLESMFVAR